MHSICIPEQRSAYLGTMEVWLDGLCALVLLLSTTCSKLEEQNGQTQIIAPATIAPAVAIHISFNTRLINHMIVILAIFTLYHSQSFHIIIIDFIISILNMNGLFVMPRSYVCSIFLIH